MQKLLHFDQMWGVRVSFVVVADDDDGDGCVVLFQFRDFLGADLCRTCSFRYFQVIFKQKIFSSSTHVM